ncbi:probable aspartic proteinase GIP1 [Dioscorea cayenensis subsp. rotundata]|uniref:Probable aspartic proteinase GIP1 n=1 Tax=Dioscorea cayennensis subsp. rotundata TaxID=55577 RepID=A0AB40BRI9_DIOCR|nr:probable aspartic proteinase GIP1 [Dioscorea cayenensis subsp. rotundata]
MAKSIPPFSFKLIPTLIILLSSQPPLSIPSPLPLFSPITKHQSTLLYTTTIHIHPPPQPIHPLIHLGSSSSFLKCSSNYTQSLPLLCNSSSLCFSCTHSTCFLLSQNPISQRTKLTPALQTTLSLPSTNGHIPAPFSSIPHHLFSCSSPFLLKGFPKFTSGLLSLGFSNSSFPSQLSSSLSLPTTFSLCLSGSPSAPGIAFFGSFGPFFFLPLPNLDISKSLTYTPLLSIHNEYYINLISMEVNGHPIPFKASKAKLSTVQPYTSMQTQIYEAFLKVFMLEAEKMKLRMIDPVKPFSACYSADSASGSVTGPSVPIIDLVLHGNDTVWRIYGVNSMVWVEMGAGLCLAFVDGGSDVGDASIVVGGHQMEDVLVQLDLERMRVGFSSSLLANGTSCSNFNFTASF